MIIKIWKKEEDKLEYSNRESPKIKWPIIA
jgi:hypothetical protein